MIQPSLLVRSSPTSAQRMRIRWPREWQSNLCAARTNRSVRAQRLGPRKRAAVERRGFRRLARASLIGIRAAPLPLPGHRQPRRPVRSRRRTIPPLPLGFVRAAVQRGNAADRHGLATWSHSVLKVFARPRRHLIAALPAGARFNPRVRARRARVNRRRARSTSKRRAGDTTFCVPSLVTRTRLPPLRDVNQQ